MAPGHIGRDDFFLLLYATSLLMHLGPIFEMFVIRQEERGLASAWRGEYSERRLRALWAGRGTGLGEDLWLSFIIQMGPLTKIHMRSIVIRNDML